MISPWDYAIIIFAIDRGKYSHSSPMVYTQDIERISKLFRYLIMIKSVLLQRNSLSSFFQRFPNNLKIYIYPNSYSKIILIIAQFLQCIILDIHYDMLCICYQSTMGAILPIHSRYNYSIVSMRSHHIPASILILEQKYLIWQNYGFADLNKHLLYNKTKHLLLPHYYCSLKVLLLQL